MCASSPLVSGRFRESFVGIGCQNFYIIHGKLVDFEGIVGCVSAVIRRKSKPVLYVRVLTQNVHFVGCQQRREYYQDR